MTSRQWTPLRIVTQRIASTPPAQLHQIAPALADTLAGCAEHDFAAARTKTGHDDRDAGVVAHRFKTQLASLLQAKPREARWAAVVLVKAAVERGGAEALRAAEPWARALLGLLGRPEPVATRRIAVLTLTRIFVLTHGQPGLVREITTPLLAGFVSACLSNVAARGVAEAALRLDPAAPLLRIVLQAMIKLLPQHPAPFRPFVGKLRSLLAPILAPTPSNTSGTTSKPAAPETSLESTTALAQRLLALLPVCAPKNTSSAEWAQSLDTVLAHTHRTADHVFRAVREQHLTQAPQSARPASFEGVVRDEVDDALRLPGWQGIYAGAERLAGLLRLVQAHVASTSALEITIPLGAIFAALGRVLAVVEPVRAARGSSDAEGLRPEVAREEREGLWSCLPAVHAAAVDAIWTVTERVGMVAVSFAADVLEQLLWIFEREGGTIELRVAVYRAFEQIIRSTGPSMEKSRVSALAPVLRRACEDLLPPAQHSSGSNAQANGSSKSSASHSDAIFKLPSKEHVPKQPRSSAAATAQRLVLTALSRLPPEGTPKALRRELDRAAILTRDRDALLASVLSPPAGTPQAPAASLLPFLARAHPAAMGTEALLRPRLPLFRAARTAAQDDDELGEANGDSLERREVPYHSSGLRSFESMPGGDANGGDRTVSKLADVSRDDGRGDVTPASSKRKRTGDDAPSATEHPPEKRQQITAERREDDDRALRQLESPLNNPRSGPSLAVEPPGPEIPFTADFAGNPDSMQQSPATTQLHERDEGSIHPYDVGKRTPRTVQPAVVATRASESKVEARKIMEDDDSSSSEIPPIILDSSSDEGNEGEGSRNEEMP